MSNLDERDAGQAFKSSIPSRYDAAHTPMEAQQLAAEDLKAGKIDKDMFDMIVAACSRSVNKIKEDFDRLSGRNHFAESRLRVREVYDTSPPVNIASQQFTQDGGFSMTVECAGHPFTVKVDANGKTFIQAEDVGEIPLPAQQAAAQKARLIWHAENSQPQWGFKGGFRLEATQRDAKTKQHTQGFVVTLHGGSMKKPTGYFFTSEKKAQAAADAWEKDGKTPPVSHRYGVYQGSK